MEVIHEIPISAHKANRMMHLFTKDPFIEENFDPELAKTLTMICTAIDTSSFDIKFPEDIETKEDQNSQQNVENSQGIKNEEEENNEIVETNMDNIQENQEPIQEQHKVHKRHHRKVQE